MPDMRPIGLPSGRPQRSTAIRHKALLGIVAGVLIGGATVIGVGVSRLNELKPRVTETLTNAIGHPVSIQGRIGLGWSLHPTIAVNQVTIANPPGFSRPDLAHLRAIDIRLSLLPLLRRRLSIDSVAIQNPDILLERAANGQENWQTTAKPSAPATSSSTTAAARQRFTVSLAQLIITDGHLAYRDDKTGHVAAVDLHQASLTEHGSNAPATIQAQAVVNGLTVEGNGQTGSLEALQAGKQPWPVSLTLNAAGATLNAKGTIAQPLAAKGYVLDLTGTAPDLAALRPLAPNAGLPALKDVAIAAHVADSGGPVPTVSAVSLSAGSGTLAPLIPGVTLTSAKLSFTALNQPVSAQAQGAWDGTEFSATATLGSISQFLTGQPTGAFPVDVSASAGPNGFSMKGGVSDPAQLRGLNLAVSAATPDLAALSSLLGRPLPRLTNVTFSGQVADAGTLAQGIALTNASFSSDQGDLRGDLSLMAGQPPTIKGTLTSNRLDLDALQAAEPAPQAAPGAPAPSAPSAKTAAPAPRSGHLFPDTPLPFGALRTVNADLHLTVGALTVRGETWRNATVGLALDGGRLRVDPLQAQLPAGALNGAITADATQAAPPVTIRLNAPAVGLAPLLAMLRAPQVASGTANVQADLHGAGESPHAIAATLGGTASISMSGGTINTELRQKLAGPALTRINPAALLVHGGTTDIRCLNVRMNAQNGQAKLDPIALSSGLISTTGSGTLNLGAETMDLHLRPQGRIGGTGFQVPLTVTGSFADPHAVLNDTGAAQAGVEAVISILSGKKVPGVAAPPAVSCGPGAAEHAPAAAAPAKPLNPAAILQQFLRAR